MRDTLTASFNRFQIATGYISSGEYAAACKELRKAIKFIPDDKHNDMRAELSGLLATCETKRKGATP